MHVITVSRQFGSGGRELGKRLADILGWDYYDKEIIEKLADERGMNPDHVRHLLSHHGWHTYQLTYRNSFSHIGFSHAERTEMLVRQREVIREIAAAGNDCIIVGRDADVILKEYDPFRIFVCADMESRLKRCMAFERKKPPEQQLTERVVLKNIKRIDKFRMRTREIVTGKHRSDSSMFDLILNTAGWSMKSLSEAAAEFSLRWFAGRED